MRRLSELSTIIQTLQELQRMHSLNLELLEQLDVVCQWIIENKLPIPNKEKLNSLLLKAQTLLQELYFEKTPTLLHMKLSDENLQGDKSDKEFTEPKNETFTSLFDG